MNTTVSLIGGASIGAALMYLFDPDRGERRRTELRHALETELRDADLGGRARTLGGNLGTLGGNLNAIGGSLGMMAPVRRLGTELGDVIRDPRSFRPALSGGRLSLRRRRSAIDVVADQGWYLLGAVAGAAAVAWLMKGAWSGGGRIRARKTIVVNAPVERVFEYWSRFENFPRFMSNVREVRTTGPSKTHWVVAGPAGAPVEWDAVVTTHRPNEALGWKTVEGSLVDHSGIVRFHRQGPSTTRVEVEMSYRPLGGTLGHGVASLFGADPESVMDDDLQRFKSQVEQGAPSGQPGAAGWR